MSSFLEDLDINCNPFYVQVDKCVKVLVFQTNTPDEIIRLIFTDGLNKTYDYIAISDSSGFVEINTSIFPIGVFNPYRGILKLEGWVEGTSPKQPVYFLSDTFAYRTLHIEVMDSYVVNYNIPEYKFYDLSTYICCCRGDCFYNPCQNDDE